MKKRKVLVAMSGGVDSSVAAALLKEEGYEVGGATIRTWAPNDCELLNTRSCCGLSGVEDAREVAHSLDIPYWVFNFEKSFKAHVVDYFAAEYKQGRTPNPCIACNEHVKFRQFLVRAKQLGFDAIATGHYARIDYSSSQQAYYIAEGVDQRKDQSYVLFPLSASLLQDVLMPLGRFTKTFIREKARALGLHAVMDKPDSQEICFIPSNDYGTFLQREYSKNKTDQKSTTPAGKGPIRMRDGRVLGQHEGYFHFTRGQRRGLGVAHKERLYVLDTKPETNEVVVGTREEIFESSCIVGGMNWFLASAQPVFRAQVKIRSQHRKAHATVTILDKGKARIVFDEAQDAITPGQGAVLYENEKVLGGGWIQDVG
jgi:tRNA-uridine 2-sulfurtransferase